MFGMDMPAMLKMALGMIEVDNQAQLDSIVAELQKMEFEPGEKEKVCVLLRAALGAFEKPS